MSVDELVRELDDVISNVKMKLLYYQTENIELKRRLKELKRFVKDK